MFNRYRANELEIANDPLLDNFLAMLVAERGATLNTVAAYLSDLTDFKKYLIRIDHNKKIILTPQKNLENELKWGLYMYIKKDD